jgi:hypothetical protein
VNQRNVEALRRLIEYAMSGSGNYGGFQRVDANDVARELAAQGVLVPSTLTDEEAMEPPDSPVK